uniref:Uncharacterized protein n=1 Tax=Picea glauca TaxID=3330 RepID=A0A101M0Y1_PICGL|nr:hypothetical protein ABT39_MTgene4321 [Picea glauca]QHR88450.1 hypothetical protein Q903MT_gene2463 [Picea sitchensis]
MLRSISSKGSSLTSPTRHSLLPRPPTVDLDARSPWRWGFQAGTEPKESEVREPCDGLPESTSLSCSWGYHIIARVTEPDSVRYFVAR